MGRPAGVAGVSGIISEALPIVPQPVARSCSSAPLLVRRRLTSCARCDALVPAVVSFIGLRERGLEPWPCEATPKPLVTARVESRRMLAASVPVLIGMPGTAGNRSTPVRSQGTPAGVTLREPSAISPSVIDRRIRDHTSLPGWSSE